MISCKANNSTTLELNISLEENEIINNCMYFKDKYFFFFCEKYCEEFNITKESPIFDGRVE